MQCPAVRGSLCLFVWVRVQGYGLWKKTMLTQLGQLCSGDGGSSDAALQTLQHRGGGEAGLLLVRRAMTLTERGVWCLGTSRAQN
jgi:hypothetical protein